jgi:hypothetical protein
MKARRPVKTIVDYRPAPATRTSTVERPNQADEHDTAARQLTKQVLIRAAEDLCARSYPSRPDYKTDEGREAAWCMGRKAALLREIRRRGLTPTDRMP